MPSPTLLYVDQRHFSGLSDRAPVRVWRNRLEQADLLTSSGDGISETGSPAHRLAVVHASLKWAEREEGRVDSATDDPPLRLPKVPDWTLLAIPLMFAGTWYLAGLFIALLGTGLAVGMTLGVLVVQTREADRERRDEVRQGAQERVKSARRELVAAMEAFHSEPFAWRRGDTLVVCCPDLYLLRDHLERAEHGSRQYTDLQAHIGALEVRIEELAEDLTEGWSTIGLTSELAVSDEDTMAGQSHRPTTAAPLSASQDDEVPEEIVVPDHAFEQAETNAS